MPSPESFFDRADALVLEALRLPVTERQAFLDRACAGEGDLRREVDSLLDVDTGSLRDVGQPLFELFENDRGAPDRIGPYRITGELGSGGAAKVYAGVRVDGSDPRAVALKVLRATGADAELVRRFEREGEILADLRHPYIARLRGGGVTEEGRPFLVMDKVDGPSLDRWVSSKTQLSLRRRLDLFIKICEAVSYAHGRLVVHGDLKPGNILVQENEEPRILDFGIAKLLDPATLQPRTVTLESERRLTPAYASPEQLRHQPLSTASDVYSAGVVLFELLAGRRPKEPGFGPDWRRRFLVQETPRMSEVTDGATSRRLAGDLDAIVAKALRREPDERYSSVAKLAEDIERHLVGLPVVARRRTFFYSSVKWLRRHRTRLLAAAMAFGALALWITDRERQRALVEGERDKAESVRDFLLELFTMANPNELDAGELTVREMLERGHDRLDDLRDQPAVLSSFMGVIGEVYGEWGEVERALELTREALEIEQVVGTPLSKGLAERRYGGQLRQSGHLQESESHLRRSVSWLEGTTVAGTRARSRYELAMTWNEMGLTLAQLANSPGARDAYVEALSILEGLGKMESDVATSVRNNQAILAYQDGRYKESIMLCKVVLEEQKAHFGTRHPSVASALNNLAAAYLGAGDFPKAGEYFSQALAILDEFFTPGHDLVLTSRVNLAAVKHELGELEEAEALLRHVVTHLASMGRGKSHLGAVSLNNLANVLTQDGRWREAESLYRRALEIHLEQLGPDHPQVFQTRGNMGYSMLRSGRREEGERELVAGLEGLRRTLGDEHPDVLRLSADLVEALRLPEKDRHLAER